jgi:hypothetical protein
VKRIVEFEVGEIMPTREDVLERQGIPAGAPVKDRILALADGAMDMFAGSAEPIGMMSELSIEQFADIYAGEGENAPDTPLGLIYPQASHLALFVLTMGGGVSARIEELFREDDFALGSMLDAVASLAADNAADVCEGIFLEELRQRNLANGEYAVLGYSPGYCGWHVSGQQKLFSYLKPERIGVTLSDSSLMSPLKSVSGVLVAGKKEIHFFKIIYPFCRSCTTYSCRPRIKSLKMA